ncbi:hypothetical protein [Tersicoccus sp. Bi-70]|uniref:hypothetical protein n=1 Tax=Tersicoccus sp. Bi-70 TaxID=1897634 RepID=UPI000976FF91|nr:hypothetical protein [Tersicoccus sp. Bi-70]OMH30608.1 hypothetical protein BGP79_11630 [Tersicoccus sp. Bi-70]
MELSWLGVVGGPLLVFLAVVTYRHRVPIVRVMAALNRRLGFRANQRMWDQDLDGSQLVPGIFGAMAMGFAVTVSGVVGLITSSG